MRNIKNNTGTKAGRKGLAFILIIILALSTLVTVSTANVSAEDVILHPGYITGTLYVTGENVSGGSISASNATGGYTSSTSATYGKYNLIVEGGYTYTVTATAYMNSYPTYKQLTLGKQTVSVNVGETATLDFTLDPGYIGGSINVTGGTLKYCYLYANYYNSSSSKSGSAYFYNYSGINTFNFPITPEISNDINKDGDYYDKGESYLYVYGYAYIDGTLQSLPKQYINVSVGKTTYVYFNVSTLGTVKGHISVQNEQLSYAYIYCYPLKGNSICTYANSSGDYLLKLPPGEWKIYAVIYFNSYNNYLPTPKKAVSVIADQTITVDFDVIPGYATGAIKLTGANTEMKYAQILATNLTSWVSGRSTTYTNTYKLILSPGNYTIGRSYNFLCFDYPNASDPSLYSYFYIYNYSLSTATNIISGTTVNGPDFSYQTATITVNFYVDGGGTLRSPRLYASRYSYPEYVYACGSGSWTETTIGKATITVLPGTYSIEAKAYVGSSLVTFGKFTITIEAGDAVEQDVGAPVLNVTAPKSGEIVHEKTISIKGTATDDTGVKNVTVNGLEVTLASTNNPNDPKEVAFSTTVSSLVLGENIITVKATDIAGKSTSVIRIVYRENLLPVAEAGANQTTYKNTAVEFSGLGSYDSDGTIVSYAWNFGDGTTGTGITTTHAYVAKGVYTVTLTVTDDAGATAMDTCVITVLNKAPIANAGIDQTVYTDVAVSFDASGSYDSDGSIASYAWDFGDSAAGTGVTATHTYTDDGVYTVTLTVTDDDGATATDSCVITVLNKAPVANAGLDQTVYKNELVQFDASQSYDSDGTIASYSWDFGDGATGSGITATHTYTNAGTYTVTLTVTDDDGATATDTCVVTVLNRAPSISSIQDQTATVGTEFNFQVTASDPDGDALTFSDDTNLFDIDPATGLISFMPTAEDVGEHVITIAVSDGSDSASTTFTLTVLEPHDDTPAQQDALLYALSITLRVAGTPGNTVSLIVKENGVNVAEVAIVREAGNPNEQAETLTVNIYENRTYEFVLKYDSSAGGSNPVKITVEVNGNSAPVTTNLNLNAQHTPQETTLTLEELLEGNANDNGNNGQGNNDQQDDDNNDENDDEQDADNEEQDDDDEGNGNGNGEGQDNGQGNGGNGNGGNGNGQGNGNGHSH